MLENCVPIRGLTNYFRSITNGTSDLLEDYLKVTTSLSQLNQVIAATLSAVADSRHTEVILPDATIIQQVLPSLPERVLSTMPHFDFSALVQAVLDQRHTSTQDIFECMVYEGGTSLPLGEMWLIGCAIHPLADIGHVLDPVLGPFLGAIPFTLNITEQALYFDYLGVGSCSTVDVSHPMPELGVTLKQVVHLHKTQPDPDLAVDDAIYQVIRAFVRIGLNIVDTWQLYRDQQNPAALMNEGQEYCVKTSVQNALSLAAQNPHGLSYRVRSLLKCMDIESFTDRILNSNIPKLLNQGLEPEYISYLVYQSIMGAAVHSRGDEDDPVLRIAQQRFDGWWGSTSSVDPVPIHYRPLALPQEVHHVLPTYDNDPWLRQWTDRQQELAAAAAQVVEFKLVGPAINPFQVARFTRPSAGECCAICGDEFSEEVGCMKLKACGHLMCSLDLWKLINGLYPHKVCVPCPCCRADVCSRRAIEKVE
jgi:hypothetical protein